MVWAAVRNRAGDNRGWWGQDVSRNKWSVSSAILDSNDASTGPTLVLSSALRYASAK